MPTEPQHLDNERAGGDSPVPGAQHNNEALWTSLARLPLLFRCLLSSSQGSAMMSYFSEAWHSMTHSAPQMVLTVIQLAALSVAGQHVWAKETLHTRWSLVSRGENQQPPTQDMIFFFFTPWISFQACDVCHSELWRQSSVGEWVHDQFKFSVNVTMT